MGKQMIRISIIYLFIATGLGMYMSIMQQFQLSTVHTHISLLGWTTMTVAGILYHMFEDLEKSKLAKFQFYLFNIGLPVMMIGLVCYMKGYRNLLVLIEIGSTMVSAAILLLGINILTGMKKDSME